MSAAKLVSCSTLLVLLCARVPLAISADPPPPIIRVYESETTPKEAAIAENSLDREAAAQRFEAITGVDLEANETHDLVIAAVRAESHAARADLKVGDVLLQVDDYTLAGDKAFAEYLGRSPAKNSYIVKVLREGKTIETILGENVTTLGMTVTWDEAKRPVVQRVAPNSPAADAHILVGDFVVAVNELPTKDYDSFQLVLGSTLQKSRTGDKIRFTVLREGATKTAVVIVNESATIPVLKPKPHVVVGRIDHTQLEDSVTATLFSTGPFHDPSLRISPGFVGAVGVIDVRQIKGTSDIPGKSILDVTIENLPAGTYTLVAHRYGDLRNLVGGSAGLVNVVLDTIVVDQSGLAKVEGKSIEVHVKDLAGRTASLLKVDPQTFKVDPSDELARYDFNAFGVFGWAHPPIADTRIIIDK